MTLDGPTLPPELLRHIFTILSTDVDGPAPMNCNYNVLCSCALVSRSWIPHVRECLLRKVDIPQARLAMFSREIANVPMYAALVKSFQVSAGRGMLPEIARVVGQLPNLRELCFHKPISEGELDEDVLAAFKNGPPIRALRIHCPSLLVIQLVSQWPSLEFLDVTTRAPCHPTHLEGRPPPPFRLYEVRWHVDLLMDKDLIDLEWVLSNSRDSLNILQFRKPLPEDVFTRVVSHLRSLRVVYFPAAFVHLLRHCTALEELVMNDYLTPPLLEATPESIQHISFECQRDFPLGAFLKFLASHRRLHTITIHDTRILSAHHWESITAACRAYRLTLHFLEDGTNFALLEDEDLVPVSRFPRFTLAWKLNNYQVLHP